MARKPETNFTHCTRACPPAEHKHYVIGGYTYIRYTLERDLRHNCSTATHFHRTETVPRATLLQRLFPGRRIGRL